MYRLITFCFVVLTIFQFCSVNSKLNSQKDNNKIRTGQLNDSTFLAVKKYLTRGTATILKDTIIIKYDYNYESCWDILDQSEADHIMGFVKRHQERVKRFLLTRQNVSFFAYREPGNSLNKIKKWDNTILIDSSKRLFRLVFNERQNCGNSILLLPDKRFIYLRSDSHTEILDLTQEQIDQYLTKN